MAAEGGSGRQIEWENYSRSPTARLTARTARCIETGPADIGRIGGSEYARPAAAARRGDTDEVNRPVGRHVHAPRSPISCICVRCRRVGRCGVQCASLTIELQFTLRLHSKKLS